MNVPAAERSDALARSEAERVSARGSVDARAGVGRPQNDAIPWLIIGMGSMAYGKERRAVTALKHMPRIRPHFLTTIWEDGTVGALLRANGFDFTPVSVGYLGRARLRWTLQNIWLMPRLFWTVLRKYHGLHCRGVLVLALQPFANVLPALCLLKLFSGARCVFYLGDIPTNTRPNRALCRIMTGMADAIIVNSEAVRRGLAEAGVPADRVHVVFNGAELERFQDATPLPWRERFGWSGDALLVGYAGQFAPNKGVWDFLRAAEMVLECGDRYRFVLIGKIDPGNDCYRGLEAHIGGRKLEGKIVFAGWSSEMERAYATLDVVVVPSRHEDPAPNVNIEAMASGVPVIATRTGGSPELVLDGTTGFLVDRERPGQIAEKILLLAGDAGLRGRMGQAGRERARRLFDVRENAAVVQKILLDA